MISAAERGYYSDALVDLLAEDPARACQPAAADRKFRQLPSQPAQQTEPDLGPRPAVFVCEKRYSSGNRKSQKSGEGKIIVPPADRDLRSACCVSMCVLARKGVLGFCRFCDYEKQRAITQNVDEVLWV